MMKVKASIATGWERAYKMALSTEGKETSAYPSRKWIRRMLLCEHSPIRTVEFDVSIKSIRQWVTVHLVRHWLGFIPFVHSQREDRRELEVPRDELPQGSLNDMSFSVNAQALMTISRKRLCSKASKETREAWQNVKDAIEEVDPIMAEKMVPECVYRGFCPERGCCGYALTKAYEQARKRYVSVDD